MELAEEDLCSYDQQCTDALEIKQAKDLEDEKLSSIVTSNQNLEIQGCFETSSNL